MFSFKKEGIKKIVGEGTSQGFKTLKLCLKKLKKLKNKNEDLVFLKFQ